MQRCVVSLAECRHRHANAALWCAGARTYTYSGERTACSHVHVRLSKITSQVGEDSVVGHNKWRSAPDDANMCRRRALECRRMRATWWQRRARRSNGRCRMGRRGRRSGCCCRATAPCFPPTKTGPVASCSSTLLAPLLQGLCETA